MHVWSTCRTCFQLRIYVLHPKVHQTSRIAIAVILTNARPKTQSSKIPIFHIQ